MFFSIATWNINSVRLRLPLVLRYLQEYQPTVLCLQETKCEDAKFPRMAFAAIGYEHIAIRGEKSYNGVAILSKIPLSDEKIVYFCGKEDCRYLSAAVQIQEKKLRIHNVYVPAGGDEPNLETNPKFFHKIAFLKEMCSLSPTQPGETYGLLVGDLNVAPYESDVWSHKQLLKIVSHTPIETDHLQEILRYGAWQDVMRAWYPEPYKLFTWWSYRAKDWGLSDRGRRLDHIWGTKNLLPALCSVEVLKAARSWAPPSDHVPVKASFVL